jgi:hypothetical protein
VTSATVQQLKTLAVRRARVAVSAGLDALQTLAKERIKLCMLQDPFPSLAIAKALGRDAIGAIEGFNEINNNTGRFRYNNLIGWPAVLAAQGAMYAEAQSWDSTIPVLSPSQSVGPPRLGGDMRAIATHGNAHVYLSYGVPFGFGPGSVAQIAASAGRNMPGRAFWITETGYANYTPGGVSLGVQAIRVIQVFLDGLLSGAIVTTWYQLQDYCTDPANPECHYGLFAIDGTAKPAARALSNFIAIMGYPLNAPEPSSLIPLAVEFKGLPYDAKVAEFVAGNGAHRFVMWRENNPTLPMNPTPVTMVLAKAGVIQLYSPVIGTGRMKDLVRGTTEEIMLGENPIVVQVEMA